MALPSLGLRSFWLIRKTMSQFVRDHRVPGVGLHSKVSVVPYMVWYDSIWEGIGGKGFGKKRRDFGLGGAFNNQK